MDVVGWLLDGDPSVRWQTRRDLLDEPAARYRSTQSEVAGRGWGAALLAQRGPQGRWADGWYSPKWTSTFYTLQTLSLLGLPGDHPEACASVDLLLDRAVRLDEAGRRPNWARDVCVAGMLLRTSAHFGRKSDPRLRPFVEFIVANQLGDGGWNCQSTRRRVTHSSFHTTLSVLEGLDAAGLGADRQAEGREFLLGHRLFQSHRTGQTADPRLTSFSFPRYWYYDVLRALEHFAQVRAAPEHRLDPAIDMLIDQRRRDGRWNLGRRHSGSTWLTMERGAAPSRVITLAALRVLRWWPGEAPPVAPGPTAADLTARSSAAGPPEG